eukprot:gene25332-10989_t
MALLSASALGLRDLPRKAFRALLEETPGKNEPFTIQRTNPGAEGFDHAWVDSEAYLSEFGTPICIITRLLIFVFPVISFHPGVGEANMFTMTKIGYYMSRAGTSGDTAHSAFSLTLRCPADQPIDWVNKCSCPGHEDVAIYQLETSTFEFRRTDWFILPLITPDSSGSPAPVRSVASLLGAVGASSRKLVEERNNSVDELLYATEGLDSLDQRLANKGNQFSYQLPGQHLRPAMDMPSILDDRQSGTTKPFQPFVHEISTYSRKLVEEPNNSVAELLYATEGLNSVDKLFADNGNAFPSEPPDQALCVGNGFIVEGVNGAGRIRSAATGATITDPIALNRFFGYPSQIDRKTRLFGPDVGNPSCLFDAGTGRFFFSVVISDVDSTTGDMLGTSRLELAVSKTSDPTGEWWIYRIPIQNDGSEGTPNHSNGPAIGDSLQIGHDKYGLYFTTNEYGSEGYNGSNIYAVSKRDLAQGAPITVHGILAPMQKYPALGEIIPFHIIPTKLPADAPANADADGAEDGTTYMLMTNQGTGYRVTQVALWKLSGTESLVNGAGYLSLSLSLMQSETIGNMFNYARQKTGDYPLGQSLGQPLGLIDVNSAKVVNVMHSAGKLWAAVQTQGFLDGNLTTGIYMFKVTPKYKKLEPVGFIALAGQHMLLPVVAVNSEGQGAVGFTLVGPNFFPSYAYAPLTDNGVGPIITVALEGKSPQDGFTEYSDFSPRPRWGSYGAAACDEHGDVYMAGEFIAAPPCTQQEFDSSDGILRCGGTRTYWTNWASGIIKLKLNGEEDIQK